MNIVFIHRGGASLSAVASAIAAQGGAMCAHVPPITTHVVAAYSPAVIVVDVPTTSRAPLCRALKSDERTATVPLLVIAPEGEHSPRWAVHADDVLDSSFSVDTLSKRLRSWSTLQEAWSRRIDAQSASTLLVLRRVAALARRARGVVGERLVQDAHAFGRFLGLAEEEQQALEDGARLHDFGDLTLPQLEPDMASTLARYRPEISESLLAPLVSRTLLAVIRHCNERWDGTGYPDQLEGSAIPRLARIMRLLVRLDGALREGHGPESVLEILAADVAGGGSDPELHAAFVRWYRGLTGQDAHQIEA